MNGYTDPVGTDRVGMGQILLVFSLEGFGNGPCPPELIEIVKPIFTALVGPVSKEGISLFYFHFF